MRLFAISTVTFCIFVVTGLAQTAKPDSPKATINSLAVEVENGKSLRLAAADFAKLARKEVKAKDHDGKESVYSGVELREILLLADAKFGKDFKGAQLANFVLIEAADGYKALFAAAELDAGFTDKSIILADTKDGKPLPDTHGPWQMIVPDDKKHGRWVRQLTVVRLRSAK